MHVSIVGGEPLVSYREMEVLLPKLDKVGIRMPLLTSAVRPIPVNWSKLGNFQQDVSVDGLAPEDDRRRAPATHDCILRHIVSHTISVHWTNTRQLLKRHGYLRDFATFWPKRKGVRRIWFSLYTPQEGDRSEERLTREDRIAIMQKLACLRLQFRKVDAPSGTIEGFLNPPRSPAECIFSQVTTCVSTDLATRITPCQFGGSPVCSECECMASAGPASVGGFKVTGLIPASSIYSLSEARGEAGGGRQRSSRIQYELTLIQARDFRSQSIAGVRS